MHITEHMAKLAVAADKYEGSPQQAADLARTKRDVFVAAYVPGKAVSEVRFGDTKYQKMADGCVVVLHMRLDQVVSTDVLTAAEAAEVVKVLGASSK